MSEAAETSVTTERLKRGVQREYRQLMKQTLEALNVELQPVSRNLVTIHEDMGKLRENLDTVSQQAAGVLRVIQAIRGRLNELDTDLDEEDDADNPEPGEDEALAGGESVAERHAGT